MPGDLMGINPMQGGAIGILVIAVLMVLTGRLIPRRTYEDLKEERDTWRAAHTESEKARAEERAQTDELLEMARTAGHILNSLPKPSGEVQASDPVDGAHLP